MDDRAVEGIDMITYGYSDLSARLGVHLRLEHKTFRTAGGQHPSTRSRRKVEARKERLLYPFAHEQLRR
jgi:2-keto-3-deoxy-L-rhamnonate aldolase RhmA